MSKKVFAASACLSVLLGLSSGSRVWAKPPDLPAENQIQCPDAVERPAQGTESATAPMLDTLVPAMAAAWFEHILYVLTQTVPSNVEALVSRLASPPVPEINGREQQAVRLFKTAENLQRRGELEKARNCYQRVHLLTPTSRWGQLAIDRLVEIEDRLREAEEAETPATRPGAQESRRQRREYTIPLGLVEVSY